MHIGFVTHFHPADLRAFFPPATLDALEHVGRRATPVLNLLPALLAQGHRISIYCAERGVEKPVTLRHGNLAVHIVPHRPKMLRALLDMFRTERKALVSAILNTGPNPPLVPRPSSLPLGPSFHSLQPTAYSLQPSALPDILHAHWTQDGHALAALDTGLPTVVTVHDAALAGACHAMRLRPAGMLATLLGLECTRRTLRRATELIAVAPYVGEHLRKVWGYRGTIHVIPNAVAGEAGDGRQTADDRRRTTEGGGQNSEFRSQKSEAGGFDSPKSDICHPSSVIRHLTSAFSLQPSFQPTPSLHNSTTPILPYPHTSFLIGDLTAWNRLKNPKTLLRAFALLRRDLPQARLLLWGEGMGPDGPAQQWAARRHLAENVEFRGWLEHTGVLRELKRLDLFVHPSREEACCMSILEAMAMGVPVIAGRQAGGVAWELDGGRAGILVNVRSRAALAGSMRRLLDDPGEAVRLGKAACERVRQEFQADGIAQKHLVVYTRLAAAPAGS